MVALSVVVEMPRAAEMTGGTFTIEGLTSMVVAQPLLIPFVPMTLSVYVVVTSGEKV
jgi:hypothetical protein